MTSIDQIVKQLKLKGFNAKHSKNGFSETTSSRYLGEILTYGSEEMIPLIFDVPCIKRCESTIVSAEFKRLGLFKNEIVGSWRDEVSFRKYISESGIKGKMTEVYFHIMPDSRNFYELRMKLTSD